MRTESDNAVIKSGANSNKQSREGGRSSLQVTGEALLDSADDVGDFASYIQSKRAQGAAGASGRPSVMAFPSNHHPGAFRVATEGGKAGGIITSDSLLTHSNSNVGFAINNSTASEGSYQAAGGPAPPMDDGLMYLGGPIVGSGFNMRGNHLKTVVHQPSSSSKLTSQSSIDLASEADTGL